MSEFKTLLGPMRELPMTEPEIVPCPFVTGISMKAEGPVVVVSGWREAEGERRLSVQFAITKDRLLRVLAQPDVPTFPEPVATC